MKYIDFIAYPIALFMVYVVMCFANWEDDPAFWSWNCRAVWVMWGMAWGFMIQWRIKHDK